MFNSRRFLLTTTTILTIILALVFTTFLLLKKADLISPIATTSNRLGFSSLLNQKPSKIVYGFLPYWNFKYHDQIPYHQLTHLSLFGVAFNQDGTVQKFEEDYLEPGYSAMHSDNAQTIISKAKQRGTKVTLALRSFDNDITDSITSSPDHTQTLINATIALVDTFNFDGINIDFEYVGSPSHQSRTNFTSFVDQLSTQLKQHDPNLHVSIDVFADSADNNRIWQLDSIGPLVDHIIIMAYDFHRPSSSTAGPVAPLYGSQEFYDEDITSLLADHLKTNSSQSLILGVPFYGYQWRTTDQEHLSNTYPRTGSLATYKRVQQVLGDQDVQSNWDPVSLSPWLVFKEEDTTQQIYYEDTRSLGLKYDLVNQTNLAGIAIWALGYDGNHSELWQLISQKFN